MKEIPDSHKDLLTDDARALAYLATLMPDGTPQLTPLWFNSDGQYIYVNSAKGRVKDKNMRARPSVAVVIQDRRDDNRYIQVRGKVVEVTEQGAMQHIEKLATKYGRDHWQPPAGQVRVKYTIQPDSVTVYS